MASTQHLQRDGAHPRAQASTSAETTLPREKYSEVSTHTTNTPPTTITSADPLPATIPLPHTPRILATSASALEDADEIDLDPQSHFLSPMASYEYWSDDDEDDDDGPDWDAGIIDFGLFYEDHKKANVPLPSKWNGLLADQAQLYQQNVKQSSTAVEPEFLARSGSGDSLPGLTPDASPQVKDDMDYDSDGDGLVMPTRRNTPVFNLIITPPEEDLEAALADAAPGNETDEEDYLPLSFFVKRGQAQRRAAAQYEIAASSTPAVQLRLVRPGLKSDRTLSGKRHSWVKPGRGLYSIREGVREEAAEAEDVVAKPERALLRRGRTF
ncbi:hypothetical protein B0A48_15781 [Cryoendolithus antarcticus]|uniref:Uncharacterized protein n=1 Tax=Cryoendolithus antarcticus TaxID=1507870 RepID=A0A1V8SHS6_9PEZI|nr:hypothetical protein B0A48_15781 [Cryoendolithus antarcticus]